MCHPGPGTWEGSPGGSDAAGDTHERFLECVCPGGGAAGAVRSSGQSRARLSWAPPRWAGANLLPCPMPPPGGWLLQLCPEDGGADSERLGGPPPGVTSRPPALSGLHPGSGTFSGSRVEAGRQSLRRRGREAGARQKHPTAADCDFPGRGCGWGGGFLSWSCSSLPPPSRGRTLTTRGSRRAPSLQRPVVCLFGG